MPNLKAFLFLTIILTCSLRCTTKCEKVEINDIFYIEAEPPKTDCLFSNGFEVVIEDVIILSKSNDSITCYYQFSEYEEKAIVKYWIVDLAIEGFSDFDDFLNHYNCVIDSSKEISSKNCTLYSNKNGFSFHCSGKRDSTFNISYQYPNYYDRPTFEGFIQSELNGCKLLNNN